MTKKLVLNSPNENQVEPGCIILKNELSCIQQNALASDGHILTVMIVHVPSGTKPEDYNAIVCNDGKSLVVSYKPPQWLLSHTLWQTIIPNLTEDSQVVINYKSIKDATPELQQPGFRMRQVIPLPYKVFKEIEQELISIPDDGDDSQVKQVLCLTLRSIVKKFTSDTGKGSRIIRSPPTCSRSTKCRFRPFLRLDRL